MKCMQSSFIWWFFHNVSDRKSWPPPIALIRDQHKRLVRRVLYGSNMAICAGLNWTQHEEKEFLLHRWIMDTPKTHMIYMQKDVHLSAFSKSLRKLAMFLGDSVFSGYNNRSWTAGCLRPSLQSTVCNAHAIDPTNQKHSPSSQPLEPKVCDTYPDGEQKERGPSEQQIVSSPEAVLNAPHTSIKLMKRLTPSNVLYPPPEIRV